jgi:hypothetical protein
MMYSAPPVFIGVRVQVTDERMPPDTATVVVKVRYPVISAEIG